MTTLLIEGKRVKVDDGFLSLSPDEQARTVEEIAGQMGISPAKPQNAAPVAETGDIYQRRATAEAQRLQEIMPRGALSASADAVVMDGLPFAKDVMAGLGSVPRMVRDGLNPVEAFRREKALLNAQQQLRQELNPVASTIGGVAGAGMVAGPLAKAGGALMARAGVSAPTGLLGRMGMGAAGGAATGGLYGAGEGLSIDDRAENARNAALLGGAIGGALPAIGAGVRSLGERAVSGVRGVVNPEAEAAARIRSAMSRDVAAGGTMSADDLAAARANQQPVINADRGGETTRALARAAANVSPEARGQIEGLAGDRFYTQADRAVRKVSKIVGGNIDDVATQDALRASARKANAAAYEKAYKVNFGNNHPVQLDAIQNRVPASAVRDAMKIAKAEGRPFGEQIVANVKRADNGGSALIASIDDLKDTVTFSRAPSMREWDYIQRGLRSAKESAFRSGNGAVGTAYGDLHRELLDTLDAVNPAFKQARAGAAAAFGAEDALDAGRQFAKTTRNTLEMAKAVKRMSAPEKKLFETGFASELVDRLKSSGDRVNVINQVFGSPEAREKMVMAFGSDKAKQLEAFARVEIAMDALRKAMGNSTTARQLAEMGLVAGGNSAAGVYGLATGDWRAAALTGAATTVRYGRNAVDQRVMQKIADLLLSDDPKAMERIINNARMSKGYMEALRKLSDQIYKIAPVASGAGAAQITAQ